MADGVKRLTALQEKERTIPSPFTIPEPVVSGCAEINLLQSVIDGLQQELASLRSGQPVQATSVDDDVDMSKMAPKIPLAITGVPGTPSIFNGTEGPSPFRQFIGQCEFERMRSSRCGLRGVRVGPTVVDSDSDVVRSATRRVGCTPTQSDSDNEPLVGHVRLRHNQREPKQWKHLTSPLMILI